MADRLSAYADWLVANQNQRGTPEFDTVANAYRQLRQQGPRDGALAFSVDQAQRMAGKGIEAVGNLVGSQGMADVGTGIVEQQQRDIAAGGYQPTYGNSLTSYIGTEDFFPALGEKVLENLAPGGAAIVGTGAATVAALMGAPITALGIGGATLGGSVLMETGASAEEQEERTGDYDPATAATVGVVAGILDKVGAGKVIPKDKLAKMTVGQVAEELAKKGKTKAARDFVAQVARSARGEGLTEVAQEGLQVAGAMTQGGDYTAQELVERGGDAFMLGGTIGGGTRAAIDTAGAILPTGTQATDPEGAADLARRLQTIAQENGLNLNDIDKTSTKGAREAVDKAHVQLTEELKQIGRDLRQRLGITDTDELSVVLDKVLAAAGQREARNKTKNTVGKQEYDAIERLTGDTAEGQQMLRLMRQMNELTELHNSGYQGGVSRITDQFMPFGTNIGYDRGAIATERLLRPLVSGGAAVQTGGASLVGQTALAGAGRAIDAVTGRRSRVKRFIQQNAAKPGVQTDPSATSLRDERKQQVLAAQEAAAQDQQRRDAARARSRAMHAEVLAANAEYPSGERISPQQIMVDELGMSPQQVVRALKSIVTDPTYGPAARSAIRSFQRGGNIEALGMLIKKLDRVMAAKQPPAMRDRPIKKGGLAVYQAQEAQRSAAVQQGIRDNQALNDQLQAALEADATVSEGDRSIAKRTLEKLRMDLTRAPLQTAEAYLQDALNRASDPGVITKYVLPYVERVRVQQNAKATSEAPMATEAMSADPPINQMAVPDFGEGLSIFPKTRKLFRAIDNMDVPEGQYVADGENVTGQTYNGARVYIGPNGRPKMEVDPDQVGVPTKELGKRWQSNAVRPDRYKMVENPTGHEGSIVAVEDSSKHYFAVQYEADVPTELYRKPLKKDGTEAQQPTMRPRGFGIIKPGNEIGKIKIAGRVHPLYDTIRIEPEGEPEINQMSTIDIFNAPPVLEGTGKKGVITVEDVGRYLEKQAVDAGSKAPRTVRGGKETNTIDYTPELEDRLFQDILAEAREFYKNSPGSAYWYTFGSPKALDMMSEVIPELKEDGTNHPDKGLPLQMLFWTLISPLSGGQDPVANGKLAVDVLRYYIENGTIPLSKYRGGLFINDDAVAEREAKGETLAWTARGRTTSNALAAIQNGIDRFGSLEDFMIWMTSPHPHAEVQQMYVDLGFGSAETAKNSVSPEYADENGMTYGSQILGPKFGPFMLNNTGNESKVTKDEWFTRSWNRLVGRMFTANGKEMLSQPSSPTERMVQDRVITRVANEMGLQPAQLQALWWAYEQSLYTKLGVKSPTRDYVDAAKTVIEKIAGEAQAANAERQGRAELGELVTEATQSGQDGGILFQRSFDFDGAGDNGQLGRAPGLAAAPIAGSREPTPTEVEQASRTVKAAFEIGKPGSEFENGVPDIDAAKKIAEAINVAVIVADTHGKLASRAGRAVNRKITPSEVKGSAGFFVPNVRGPAYARGAIGVNTSESSPSYQLYTALHELGHAFETRFANTVDTDLKKVEDQIYSLNRAKFIELDAKSKRETYANTFRDVMRQVLAVAGGGDADLKISQQDAQDIVAEIVAMQRAGQVGGESIRQDYGRGRQLVALGAYTQGEVDSVIKRGETNYFHTPWEMAADAIGIYFHSPEVAKQEMPKTARLLQIAFRDNPTIQFFSLPFASIVAMVLANMLIAEGEEEEDMDPGALSMGAGALTA